MVNTTAAPSTEPCQPNAQDGAIDADAVAETEPKQELWVDSPRLYACDRQELEDTSSCLSDRILNAAQTLLRRQFPSAGGLKDTLLLGAGDDVVQPGDKFVQCVHDAVKEHWITVSSLGCVSDEVKVYCSAHLTPSPQCIKTISLYYRTSLKQLTLRVMNVSKQQGGVDCGLFAIAYATTLLNGMDPVNVVFTQARMRQHVIAALEAGTLSEFPVSCRRTVRRMSVRAIPVPVYCVCKAAYVRGDRMVACDSCGNWFHCGCVDLSSTLFAAMARNKSENYECQKCASDKQAAVVKL